MWLWDHIRDEVPLVIYFQGVSRQMKKFLSLMLGMSLVLGLATVSFAEEKKEGEKKEGKKKGGKKKKEEKK